MSRERARLRVSSTNERAAKGHSLAIQRRAIESYYRKHEPGDCDRFLGGTLRLRVLTTPSR